MRRALAITVRPIPTEGQPGRMLASASAMVRLITSWLRPSRFTTERLGSLPHAAGAAGVAHHRQGGLTAGIYRCRLHHPGEWLGLLLLDRVEPAIDQPVVGLPVCWPGRQSAAAFRASSPGCGDPAARRHRSGSNPAGTPRSYRPSSSW